MAMGKCSSKSIQWNQGFDLRTKELSKASMQPCCMLQLLSHRIVDFPYSIHSSKHVGSEQSALLFPYCLMVNHSAFAVFAAMTDAVSSHMVASQFSLLLLLLLLFLLIEWKTDFLRQDIHFSVLVVQFCPRFVLFLMQFWREILGIFWLSFILPFAAVLLCC